MTCATVRLLVAATLLLAACPGGDPGIDDPDARVDGGGGGDGGPGALSFELATSPAVPGTVGAVDITELRVWLRDIRAIGDSATGDSRTFKAELELDWRDGRGATTLSFPSAPPGVYARLDARLGQIGGDEKAWELRGRVHRSDGTFGLEIEAEAITAVSVPLDGLTLGTTPRVAVVELSLDFLAAVDWQSLPVDGDKIQLDADDVRVAAMTAALAQSFELAAVR